VQVVAHALLLREQGINVTGASIYYAQEKRRVPVPLTDDAFAECRQAITDAKAIATSGKCPPPLINDPRCLYCSAYPICLPNESAYWLGREKDAPQPQQAPRPENDDGEVLIVQKPGAHVGLRGDQIVVTVNGETMKKQPVHQTRSIYLYGAIQLSAQCSEGCLENGIDVAYFSPAGRLRGLLRGL